MKKFPQVLFVGLPVSLGAIQKVIDCASEAIMPHYEMIQGKRFDHRK
ncbi:MAG: hypothetical protein JRI45_01755 [Deltaproteobacteria bacterium]|nr:hypothetical protein [Deltaproteobacteria bacterium]MBW2067317.1 hypothetical protein [Deltaproteobacteria bacterium]